MLRNVRMNSYHIIFLSRYDITLHSQVTSSQFNFKYGLAPYPVSHRTGLAMVTMKTVLLILLTSSVSTFEITGVHQSQTNLEPGETVSLACRASSDWEFCSWTLQGQAGRHCSLEWKRAKVTLHSQALQIF